MRGISFGSVSVVLAACTLLVVGCDDEANDLVEVASAASYNVGLADNYVLLVDERLPELISLVDATDFDVLCMQEVWSEDDVNAIAGSPNTPYTASYWEDTTQEPQPPSCTEELVADLRTCATAADCENDAAGLVGCAAANCGDELSVLTAASPDCLGCLASQLEAETLDEMTTACIEEAGSTYNQSGRNGLLLLSRHAFAVTEHLELTSFINFRVVLHVQLDMPDLGETHVFCTHLATPVAGLDYAGEYDSWEDEQAKQTEAILAYIDEKAPGGQIILMGDFNNGPTLPDLSPEMEENYDR